MTSVAVVLMAALGLASCGNSTTQGTETAEEVGAQAAVTPEPSTTTTKGPIPDPDAGLSEEERRAKQEVGEADFEKRFQAWVQSDYAQSLDPATLPQNETLATYLPGYSTLEEATDHADLAVLGHVSKVRFVGYYTITTFQVERTAKGGARKAVTITQAGGLRPGPDFKSPFLSVSDAAPIILAGDRAVLLLKKASDGSDRYEIQSFSGQYRVKNGRVKTTEGNRFKDVDDTSEKAIMDRIEKHAKSKA